MRDSIQLAAAVLVKGETAQAPAFSGEWRKAAAKQLPGSISLYLKASKIIDSRSPGLSKAAAECLKLLGPGAAKQALEDPRLLAQAARAWTELNLGEPGEDFEPRPYATDARILLPKASALVALRQADQAGRVRVRVALLRALGVPARPCRLRGRPGLQYWAQWLNDAEAKPGPKSKSKGKAKGAPAVKGEWVLDEAAFPGETPEAWSMDSGDLADALWSPEQELAYVGNLERAYYALSETAQATADMDYVKRQGRLPEAALYNRPLPPRPARSAPSQPWLLLAVHRASFSTEGAMEALNPLELLLPYRPKLASWGSQARPVPESLDTLAEGFWTDRPDRARLRKGLWTDEYKSPPPAYGVLHFASISLRKPASVLQAEWQGRRIQGKLLRRDSLAPRAGVEVRAERLGEGPSKPLSALTDEQGHFSMELAEADFKAGGWLKLSGGLGAQSPATWDSLLLPLPNIPSSETRANP